MRKLQLSFVIFLLSIAFSAFGQTTWTVGPNSTHYDFTTLQAAHDAAVANDIILVHQSGIEYGDATFTKPITVSGSGYYLDENPDTQPQPAFLTSRVGVITLQSGSAGTILSGLDFISGGADDIRIYTENITIERCRTYTIALHNGATNILIQQNYISNLIHFNSGTIDNILVKNNIFSGQAVDNDATYMEVIFLNNVFTSYKSSSSSSISPARNSTFKNNIFVGGSSIAALVASSYSNLIEHNVFEGTSTSLSSTNTTGIPAADIFVGYPSIGEHSQDGRFKLVNSPPSPAIGAGEGGVDCGIFGGNNPYILSGIPSNPNIYKIDIISVGAGTATIEIGAKANR